MLFGFTRQVNLRRALAGRRRQRADLARAVEVFQNFVARPRFRIQTSLSDAQLSRRRIRRSVLRAHGVACGD